MLSTQPRHKDLLGDWFVDPDDKLSMQELGPVWLRFGIEGVLTYTILGEEKDQVFILIYEVKENNMLITCQPSNPRKEATEFFLQGDRLRLEFNGIPFWFVRLPPEEVA